jgi:hypothetical protein
LGEIRTKGKRIYKNIIMTEKNFATYKEFGKMLREVANIYSQYGDLPLADEGFEKNGIIESIGFIVNKHDFADYINPLKDSFLRHPFDVTKAAKWRDYVLECRRNGKEVEYPETTSSDVK